MEMSKVNKLKLKNKINSKDLEISSIAHNHAVWV